MKVITFLGDSITHASWSSDSPPVYSVDPLETYPSQLIKRLEPSATLTTSTFEGFSDARYKEDKVTTGNTWKAYNAGIGGHTTAKMLARFESDVLAHRSDYLIILAGVNDLANGVAPEVARDNVRTMIERARAERIRTVLALVTPWTRGTEAQKDLTDSFNTLLRALAKEQNVPLVDTFGPLQDGMTRNLKPVYDRDGIHLTAAGYKALADCFPLSIFADDFLADLRYDFLADLRKTVKIRKLHVGNQPVQALYAGGQPVKCAYYHGELIWEA